MPTVNIAPVNVIAGALTPVIPPGFSDIGNAVRLVAIYNSSGSILTVNYQGGSSFLQPFTADVFPCSSVIQAPTIIPITSQPAGVYCGTITSTFYFAGDPPPTDFPISLQPFPGDSALMAVPTVVTGFARNTSYDIQLPVGAQQISFVVGTPNTALSVINPTVTITGDQSGTTYANGATLTNGTTTSISLVPLLDSSVTVVFTIGVGNAGPITAIYASPGQSIPTFATKSTGNSTSTTPLAAPSFGANYLFEADLDWTISGGIAVISANGVVIGVMVSGNGISGDAVFKDHLTWGAFRVTTAVTVAYTGTGTAHMTIRYAPGP